MAGYPPGVPPVPPVPPPGYDPRAQRRMHARPGPRSARRLPRATRPDALPDAQSAPRLRAGAHSADRHRHRLPADRDRSPKSPSVSGTGTDTGGRCCWSLPDWWCWRSGRSISSACAIRSGRPTVAPSAAGWWCCWCCSASAAWLWRQPTTVRSGKPLVRRPLRPGHVGRVFRRQARVRSDRGPRASCRRLADGRQSARRRYHRWHQR